MTSKNLLASFLAPSCLTPSNEGAGAPTTDWKDMGKSEHFVQFYEHDTFLLESIVGFISAGLQQGEAAVVIATREHLKQLEQHLSNNGLELEKARALGLYYPLDASETLSRVMLKGLPDPGRFKKAVESVVAEATRGGRGLRAFGEMVALLWEDGKPEAAIQLEALWNDLGKKYCFALFCAYPLAGFSAEANSQPFTHICNAHTRVIPAESYTGQADEEHRLRTITLLQQKAASLEAEVARRKEIEKELRRQKL